MTKLNSNGGDDKVDELLKERYDLAKDRIVDVGDDRDARVADIFIFHLLAPSTMHGK